MIVLIPIYKCFSDLSFNELKSINQCVKILNNFKICFIFPEKINLVDFQSYLSQKNISYKKFSNIYFQGKDSYSLLLTSYFFYYSFKEFNYILIYQPDAYIFKDNFEQLISKNYSYVGAPWIDELSNKSVYITSVGNGGFSLRKTSDCLSILKKIKTLKTLHKGYLHLKLNNLFSYGFLLHISFLPFLLNFKVNKFTFYLSQDLIINEDKYWCIWVNNVFSEFKIAKIEDAINFSFESNPSFLFEMNNKKLPIGCHAWEINESDFWNKFIK
jgi:hypothetical protein